MEYEFDGGLVAAREQFSRLVDNLIKESILHDDKWANEQTNALCDAFRDYALTQGPGVEDGNHNTWNYYPNQRDLNKLARLLAGD